MWRMRRRQLVHRRALEHLMNTNAAAECTALNRLATLAVERYADNPRYQLIYHRCQTVWARWQGDERGEE